MVVIMTDEEEQALFTERVKQINRDCLQTFLPYIKAVIGILVTIGIVFLTLTIWFYKDAMQEIDSNSDLLHDIKENQSIIKHAVSINKEEIKDIRARIDE